MPRPVGEGMTGSRFPGLPPARTRNLDTLRPHHQHRSTPHGATPRPDPDRLTDHASGIAGVKATPLRGRPSGPRLDPDAAATRPHPPAPRARRRASPLIKRLTGPAPSGMT